jgi:colanic acid/amylovoran biosynthesis glycosyltransferase
MSSTTLVILPDLKTKRIDGGRFVVTEKFYDGVLEFTKYWPGPVSVFMEPSPGMTDNLDNIEIRSDEVPFHMGLLDYTSLEKRVASDPSIVLGSTSYRQNNLSTWCRDLKVPSAEIRDGGRRRVLREAA